MGRFTVRLVDSGKDEEIRVRIVSVDVRVRYGLQAQWI